MKIRGILGTASGKLGEGVAATVAGQTIMRQYQPNVKNPNTDAQVTQRAKFKLISQLAAAMSTVIVIPKKGLQSSRNLFIKTNMKYVDGDNEGAEINLQALQITSGTIELPLIVSSAEGTASISAALETSVSAIVDRVVYALFKVNMQRQLVFVGSEVVSEAGANGTFPASLPYTDGDYVVYAYGMRDNSQKAAAKYENYQVDTADNLAKLLTESAMSYGDYTFTKTVGYNSGME